MGFLDALGHGLPKASARRNCLIAPHEVSGALRNQVPNYKVSTRNQNYDSYYGNLQQPRASS